MGVWVCGVWGMGVWTKLFITTPHTKVRGTHLSHSGGRYDLRRNICSFQLSEISECKDVTGVFIFALMGNKSCGWQFVWCSIINLFE